MRNIQSKEAILSLIGIYRLHLVLFIILCLYFGKFLFIPFTLAILLTFILSPLTNKLEYYLGRIISVIITFLILFLIVGTLGYILSTQLNEFTTQLPKYKTNIENKLNFLNISENNGVVLILNSMEKLESSLLPPAKPKTPALTSNKNTQSVPVSVVDTPSTNLTFIIKSLILSLLNILGSMGLVFLLLLFMLLSRENLRERLIRLIGTSQISTTTNALNDACQRITSYLLTLLLINVIYGLMITLGLFLIGIPNAILWGSVAMILRFIPYIGVWISASFPFIVALAIAPNWNMPALTLILFILLDLVIINIIEPFLFSSNTGISALALIISALFWTLLWGPIGLLLSTPLTVCIIVIGRYIPKFSFINTILSDEKNFVLYEECYQNLLSLEFTEAIIVMNNYLKKHSLIELYDSMIVPMLIAAEIDRKNELFEESQINLFYKNLQIILDDFFSQNSLPDDKENTSPKKYYVLCLPASTERDEIASTMLMQVLIKSSFKADIFSHKENELIDFIERKNVDAICISVMSPYLIIPIKRLVSNLHQKFPDIKILIGLWGATAINPDIQDSLKYAGVDSIIFSFSQAKLEIEKFYQLKFKDG